MTQDAALSESLLGDLMAAQLVLARQRALAKAGKPHNDLAALKRRATELRDRYMWALFNEVDFRT